MAYSSRISWSAEQNRLSRALERTPPRFDLTQSNPTDAGILYPEAEVMAAFADTRALRYEPTPMGLLRAREAVSAYYGGRVGPEQILLTASTSEAYSYLFKLLCDPGDEVLVPRPSYPLFEFLAHLECCSVRQYPMYYHDGWFIDLEELRRAVGPRTRAIVYVNPNNPTGSYLKPAERDELASFGIPVIVDEVFSDYPFGETGLTLAGDFTLSGLSKVVGLPQMKLGWIVARSTEALPRLELIADTFLSVGAPVQHAAPALLAMRHGVQDQIRARTRKNLAALRSAMAGTAGRVLDVEAGWYATVQVPRVRSEEEWVLGLLDEGVHVQPGFFFDFESEAYLVLSLLTAPDEFEAGAGILAGKC